MTVPELFHFSEQGDIACFTPRPVTTPSVRAPGMDWLNGPLVWAIDAWHQPMYLFPRDCPRILVRPTDATGEDDLARHWPGGPVRMLAYVEQGWLDRLRSATLFRYGLPSASFEALEAGMWISREAVAPNRVEPVSNLPERLAALDVELRPVADLRPLKTLWETSLHTSGIRLRNAADGWT
jgi:hypothetical protein